MISLLRRSIWWLSHRFHFRGKATLLDAIGLGPSRPDVVPSGVHSARGVHGIVFQTSCPTDIMFREFFVSGVYQSDVLVALKNLLKPGDVFWDIGANYGLMSMFVERQFEGKVSVVSFEPNPAVIKELERNIEANRCRNIHVEPICLSNEPGRTSFYIAPNNSWNATLVRDFAETAGDMTEIEVEASTIDLAVQRLPQPDVIKVDVEGAEPLVIQGGTRFLGASKVPVIAEYNIQAIRDFGLTPQSYLNLFVQLGYRPHYIRRPWIGNYRWSGLQPVQDPNLLPVLCNLVFLKGE